MRKNPEVTDRVMRFIKEKITDGSWKVGDRIPSENELCAFLKLSRTSVRAALQRYNVLGILETRRGKGTYVHSDRIYIPDMACCMPAIGRSDPASRQSFREWRQARNMIEPEIAYQVAQTATPELIERLRQINKAQEEAIGDQERFIAKDKEYHMTLAAFLGNRLVERCLGSWLDMQEMHLFVNDKFGYMGGIYFHAMITDAIARGDADRARTLMLEHGRDEEQASRIFGEEREGENL